MQQPPGKPVLYTVSIVVPTEDDEEAGGVSGSGDEVPKTSKSLSIHFRLSILYDR